MTMYDTLAPRPMHVDGDGFSELVLRFDRTETRRSGDDTIRELDFDEELRFEARARPRKRAAGSIVRKPARTKPGAAPALRLVPKASASESVAVVDAALHARTRSASWKEYVENLGHFLDEQLDIAG